MALAGQNSCDPSCNSYTHATAVLTLLLYHSLSVGSTCTHAHTLFSLLSIWQHIYSRTHALLSALNLAAHLLTHTRSSLCSQFSFTSLKQGSRQRSTAHKVLLARRPTAGRPGGPAAPLPGDRSSRDWSVIFL